MTMWHQPARVHYDALAHYHSYDLAWLGPISFPLALALVAQVLVYADMLRRRCCLARRSQRTSAVVEGAALTILAAETLFGVLCIVQCIANWKTRSFVDGATLCDFQAVYASYYVFAGQALATYGVVVGVMVRIKDSVSLVGVLAVGVLLHLLAVFLATLPLHGAGAYLFAVDFCVMDLESPLFASLSVGFYVVCLAIMVVSLALERRSRRHGAQRPLALWAATAWFAVAWASVAAIGVLWFAYGSVYDSSRRSAYAWMGMLTHCNQLVVPLLFGLLWRREAHAAVACASATAPLRGKTILDILEGP